MIKVRFAPSPTGDMHIGNLRTAIFNWLFARKNNGKCFLRIEDTDRTRSTRENEKILLEVLNWMNLDFDSWNNQQFIRQSERMELYKFKAQDLLNNKNAYFCQCPPIDPNSFREKNICQCKWKNLTNGVLRFAVPKDKIMAFEDKVLGKIERSTKEIEDFAILRSDGSPTYALCVVVDDIEMEITHIIRGSDHVSNTFKQILLYEALGKESPMFCHCPIILGSDKKKLSKRDGTGSVQYYINKGFLPDGLFNILTKLGWGYENEEKFTRKRILEIFQMEQIGKSPAIFDEKKALNFNAWHLRETNCIPELIKLLEIKYKRKIDKKPVEILYPYLVTRSQTLIELVENYDFVYEFKPHNIFLEKEQEKKIQEVEWESDSIKSILDKDLSAKLRLIITGKQFSPPIDTLFLSLGKSEVLSRIKMNSN